MCAHTQTHPHTDRQTHTCPVFLSSQEEEEEEESKKVEGATKETTREQSQSSTQPAMKKMKGNFYTYQI